MVYWASHPDISRAVNQLDSDKMWSVDSLFFPVHKDHNHWILVQVDLVKRFITSYDGIGYDPDPQ